MFPPTITRESPLHCFSNQEGSRLTKRIRNLLPSLERAEAATEAVSPPCPQLACYLDLSYIHSMQVPLYTAILFAQVTRMHKLFTPKVIKVIFSHEYNVIIENVRPPITCSASVRSPLQYSPVSYI